MTQPTPRDQHPPETLSEKRDLLHDRRALAIIGGALVVVAAIGFFVVKPMLSGSSSDSSTGTVANAHVHRASTATPTLSVSPAAAPTPAPKLVIRDPFSPLVSMPATGGTDSTASAAPSAASTTPITQVSTVIVPEPGPTVTKTVIKTVAPAAKYTLVLDAVSYNVNTAAQKATVTLNGKLLVVQRGEFFPGAADGPFELVNVTPTTATQSASATFMYGDDSFSLHVGQVEIDN